MMQTEYFGASKKKDTQCLTLTNCDTVVRFIAQVSYISFNNWLFIAMPISLKNNGHFLHHY